MIRRMSSQAAGKPEERKSTRAFGVVRVEKNRPLLYIRYHEHVLLGQGIFAVYLSTLARTIYRHYHQRTGLIRERTTKNDKTRVKQRVHVESVLIPERLLANRLLGIPAAARLKKCGIVGCH